MKCPHCGQEATSATTFCKSCGGRLDFTYDEISQGLVRKKAEEEREKMGYYARQFLIFAVILFLLALTINFAAGSPPARSVVPSISKEMRSMTIDYRFLPPLKKALAPMSKELK